MNIISIENKMKKIESDIALAKQGDKDAYVRLMREYKTSMYIIAKSILKKEQDIEDAVSETILKGYINIHKLKDEKYFKTWLMKILINESKAIYKKRKREVSLEDNHLQLIKYNQQDIQIDLYKAINALDKDLRITTLLFYFEDMKYKDIAKVLKVREGTIKSRLSRAKEKLHNILKEVK